MNKIDRILDVMEHPENYSDKQLESLFRDPEMSELYTILSKTKDAYTSQPTPDIDNEWRHFSAAHTVEDKRRLVLFGHRPAAAVIIGIAASLAAVAAGIVFSTSGNRTLVSDEEYAVVHTDEVPAVHAVVGEQDTAGMTQAALPVKIFREESLTQMLDTIAAYYHTQVQFLRPDTGKLRLYFKWNKNMELPEVVETLNNFEQITITLHDNILTVE